MTSRSRASPIGRMPGMLRRYTAGDTAERAAVQHGVSGRVFVSWRAFSGLIVVGLLLVLLLFFAADTFYVRAIQVRGLHYMTTAEIFALAKVEHMHVFWVDPAEVRRAILQSPTIADATVLVEWPPNMIQVIIQEREPALVWEQGGAATWIDLQGRVMRQREDRDDLLRVSADTITDGPLGQDVRLDDEIITGALQIHTLVPQITTLRYDPIRGLGYRDERGWDAWFGVGTNMPEKFLVYNAIVADLQSRGVQFTLLREINVANPDVAFYCCEP